MIDYIYSQIERYSLILIGYLIYRTAILYKEKYELPIKCKIALYRLEHGKHAMFRIYCKWTYSHAFYKIMHKIQKHKHAIFVSDHAKRKMLIQTVNILWKDYDKFVKRTIRIAIKHSLFVTPTEFVDIVKDLYLKRIEEKTKELEKKIPLVFIDRYMTFADVNRQNFIIKLDKLKESPNTIIAIRGLLDTLYDTFYLFYTNIYRHVNDMNGSMDGLIFGQGKNAEIVGEHRHERLLRKFLWHWTNVLPKRIEHYVRISRDSFQHDEIQTKLDKYKDDPEFQKSYPNVTTPEQYIKAKIEILRKSIDTLSDITTELDVEIKIRKLRGTL